MSQEKTKDMSQYFYRASAADFMKIPGSPVAYWASPIVRRCFEKFPLLSELGKATLGMNSTNNLLFVRSWYEVSVEKIDFLVLSEESSSENSKRWFPYNKGGDFRKWYGNREFLIDWEDNGKRIHFYNNIPISHRGAPVRSKQYQFKESATWSFISSSNFGVRYSPPGSMFDVGGSSYFPKKIPTEAVVGFLCSSIAFSFLKVMNPTLNFQVGNIASLSFNPTVSSAVTPIVARLIEISREDWDSHEISWDFESLPLIKINDNSSRIKDAFISLRAFWADMVDEAADLEKDNNQIFIEAYGLQKEIGAEVPLEEVTLSCNPFYEYGSGREKIQLEEMLQSNSLRELLSYAIGCIMGRYSLDKPGLILASQGETLHDYLSQIPSPRFMPDDDAILPLTDQEWFADDATNRFSEFVRVVWGDDHLQENLDFVAESLCLHAIKPKRGESALDTIRRYLSTQFYKDHMRTYKKRPIYWLFSSGKQKAFECLVYLHRYNEGTLARMRTEYVIPLTAKLTAYADKLEQDKAASASAAETKRLEKEINTLHKQQAELAEFDEKLRHYADQRIALDLDDGVKVNYGKFGDLLAEVKAVTGEKPQ